MPFESCGGCRRIKELKLPRQRLGKKEVQVEADYLKHQLSPTHHSSPKHQRLCIHIYAHASLSVLYRCAHADTHTHTLACTHTLTRTHERSPPCTIIFHSARCSYGLAGPLPLCHYFIHWASQKPHNSPTELCSPPCQPWSQRLPGALLALLLPEQNTPTGVCPEAPGGCS